MSDFPDKTLREGITKQALASICAMLGFDYMRVNEINIDPQQVDVLHFDDDYNMTTTSIRIIK